MLKIEVLVPSLSAHRACVRGECSIEYDLSKHPSVREFIKELRETYPKYWGVLKIIQNVYTYRMFMYGTRDAKISDIPEEWLNKKIAEISCREFFGHYDFDIVVK